MGGSCEGVQHLVPGPSQGRAKPLPVSCSLGSRRGPAVGKPTSILQLLPPAEPPQLRFLSCSQYTLPQSVLLLSFFCAATATVRAPWLLPGLVWDVEWASSATVCESVAVSSCAACIWCVSGSAGVALVVHWKWGLPLRPALRAPEPHASHLLSSSSLGGRGRSTVLWNMGKHAAS